MTNMNLDSHERDGVVLVDDHAMVRDALAMLIESRGFCKVAARFDSADDLIGALDGLSAVLYILDIDLPGRSAFDAARMVMARHPRARVVFLTGHPHARYLKEARAIGASGFLTKDQPPSKLIDGIERVLKGETLWDVADRSAELIGDTVSVLSPRELEVLRYITQGLSTKDMATVMCLSPRTVERHVARLMARLGVHDRLSVVIVAMKEGLVSQAGSGIAPAAHFATN
jgi:DNA-binding NarL/FixJ family response regulator